MQQVCTGNLPLSVLHTEHILTMVLTISKGVENPQSAPAEKSIMPIFSTPTTHLFLSSSKYCYRSFRHLATNWASLLSHMGTQEYFLPLGIWVRMLLMCCVQLWAPWYQTGKWEQAQREPARWLGLGADMLSRRCWKRHLSKEAISLLSSLLGR